MIQKLIPIILFLSIHLMFFLNIFSPPHVMGYGIGLIPLLGYLFFKYRSVKFTLKEYFFVLLSFGIGFVLTFEAIRFFSVTPVYASALVGMVFSFFSFERYPLFPAIVYSGTFAGMVADYHVESFFVACSIILLGGSLFYFLKENFVGLGGKLGSIGFGAMLLPVIFKNEKSLLYEIYDGVVSIKIWELSTDKTLFFTIIISLLGTILTYWLNNKKGYGPIKASAIPSFLVAIPLQILPISGFLASIPIIYFGASFVGMTNEKTLGWIPIIVASILYALTFHFIHPYFNGYGGTLGTAACLSCLMGVLLQKTFNRQAVRIQSKT